MSCQGLPRGAAAEPQPRCHTLPDARQQRIMADVLDIDNAEEFEVDEDGDRKYTFSEAYIVHERL